MSVFESAMTRLLVHVWCECEALVAAARPCELRLQALRLELHLLETRLPRWVASGLAADEDAELLQAVVADLHARLAEAEDDPGCIALLQDVLLRHVLALVGASDEFTRAAIRNERGVDDAIRSTTPAFRLAG